jgi:hypothetical protein
VPSERCSVEEQSIQYCGWACCVKWRDAWRSDRHAPSPQYSIDCSSIEHLSEGIGTLLKDGNIMPIHVGATIHN